MAPIWSWSITQIVLVLWVVPSMLYLPKFFKCFLDATELLLLMINLCKIGTLLPLHSWWGKKVRITFQNHSVLGFQQQSRIELSLGGTINVLNSSLRRCSLLPSGPVPACLFCIFPYKKEYIIHSKQVQVTKEWERRLNPKNLCTKFPKTKKPLPAIFVFWKQHSFARGYVELGLL